MIHDHPRSTKIPKVTQIATTTPSHGYGYLFALCENGSIWRKSLMSTNDPWDRVPLGKRVEKK